MKSLSIVFPVFNEQKRLKKSLNLIDKFLKKNKQKKIEIILVNDGSTDRSSYIINKFLTKNSNKRKFINLNIKKNMGKGYALKSGVKVAKNNWILTADIDLSVKLEQIIVWEKKYLQEECFVYFGSRSHDLSNVKKNILRNILGNIFKVLNYFLFDLNIKDTQCGFKLYKNIIAKNLFENLSQFGYIHDVEIAYKCSIKNLKIIELPVVWVHKSGGKINLFIDPIKMIFDLIKLKFRH